MLISNARQNLADLLVKFDHVEKNVEPIVQEAQASPNQLSTLFADTTINSFLCNAPVAFLGC